MQLKLVGEGYSSYLAEAETGEPIGAMPDSVMVDIVKQNNAHEGLVEALRETLTLTADNSVANTRRAVDIARKALAGETG